ncbi:response regulator [bacterium]|nr:response regulator [bacterium]
MDGLELCRRIRQSPEHRQTYELLLTSKDKVEDAIRALEQGADDFLTKSADPREVVVRVKVGLRVTELYAALAEAERRLTVAGMAITLGHEIGNPLQIISGFAEMLAREPGQSAGVREKGAAILSAARRIQELIKRLQMIEHPQYTPYVGETTMIDAGEGT